MVTGAVPDDVITSVCVAGVFRFTLPNDTVVELSVNPGVPEERLMAYVFVTPPACAVSVAVCAVVTDDTVAANAALLAPAGISTEAGTTTAVLLLLNPTVVPPVGAAPLSDTVHASVPAPLIEPFAHVMALRTGVAAGDRVIA
jgi:hypothetical protein